MVGVNKVFMLFPVSQVMCYFLSQFTLGLHIAKFSDLWSGLIKKLVTIHISRIRQYIVLLSLGERVTPSAVVCLHLGQLAE